MLINVCFYRCKQRVRKMLPERIKSYEKKDVVWFRNDIEKERNDKN